MTRFKNKKRNHAPILRGENVMGKSKVIKVQALARPTKRSGYELKPGMATRVGALLITNLGAESLYVDRQTPKRKKAK